MKRVFSFTLALLLLLLSAAGCSDATQEPEETTPVITESDLTAIEPETESPTPFWDAADKVDLQGITINASCENYDSNFYNVLDWEELTGERLNDAVYDRNRFVEEALNCLFTSDYGSAVSKLEQSCISGSGDIDITYALMSNGGGLLQKGYLKAFNSVETIDMTQPFWDQGAIRSLSVLGQTFCGMLDFGFDHYDSMAVLFYNGELVEEYHLEDPYELFKNSEWTIDKMKEQIVTVSTDKNGDGKFSLDRDVYGLSGREYNFQPILFTSGVRLVGWDEENETFTFNFMNERLLQVAEGIATIYEEAANADYVHYGDYDLGRTAFSDGRSLFYSRLLGDFKQLREVEDAYGVVCFPRYDYANEDTSYFVQNPTTLFLPIVVGDDNRDGDSDYNEIGIFLQAVGAYTYDVTLDEYIENAVIGKGMRDQNSADMVRIMMQNRNFDLTQAFSFPNMASGLYTCIKNNSGYASVGKKLERSFGKLSDKIVDEVKEHQ
ncbi:MAG: extracellular solute-binding protein [Clostridia bacterium]|nr:extracellular solute-binding protein [Clostridia bacterium]